MKLQYKYFISFNTVTNGITGVSQITITRDSKITNEKQIAELTDFIKNHYNSDSVVILNFILLSKKWERNKR